jgi:hypothetical protein
MYVLILKAPASFLLRWDVPGEGNDSRLAFCSPPELSSKHLCTVLDFSFPLLSNSSSHSNPMLSPEIAQNSQTVGIAQKQLRQYWNPGGKYSYSDQSFVIT